MMAHQSIGEKGTPVMIRRFGTVLACAAAGIALAVAVTAPAHAGTASTVAAKAPSSPASLSPASFSPAPSTLALPAGFQPEGIAIGAAPFAYFGSRATGDLFRVNLFTGAGTVFSRGPGTPSLGMKLDQRGRLFVSGGTGGDARVVNAVTGAVLASYRFTTAASFVNDVVLTPGAAWFTDSRNPVLYRVPLGPGGRLPAPSAVTSVTLSGAYVHQPAPALNANGIARTPDGRALLIVQTATGLLFRVDPATGVTTAVDLGGALLPNGDGLLLLGRTLVVVQNLRNQVTVITLNRSGTAGTVERVITDPRFDTPTGAATFGHRLYLVNARFTTPADPTTPYTAVAVPRP